MRQCLKTNFLRHFIALSLFIALFGFSFSTTVNASEGTEPDQYVHVELIANKTQVKGGETIRIGVKQTIYPDWHVYWLNPGDSGTPPEINWDLPSGFSTSELEWPLAIKIPYGPLTNYGYSNEVILLQNLTLPDTINDGAFTLNAKVNLLVCHEICVPESHDVSLTLNGDTQPYIEDITATEALLPPNKDWTSHFYEDGENLEFKVITEDISALQDIKNIVIFPEEWGAIDNNANATLTLTDTGFTIAQKRGDRELSDTPKLPIIMAYKTADGENKSIKIVAIARDNIAAATPIKSTTKLNIPPPTPTSNITLWQALIFSLLGGIILNLMPCVFPVLSIKALSLINLNEKEEKKARAYGLSYTAGILLSFALIGGTLLILKAGGAEIGWGFQLQNPIVISLLAYIVFILGLNLSGFFDFSNGLSNTGQGLTQKSGHRGAFFTGVLATLVATPCTAPFMGAALGFALTQPALISMLVFFSLGLGLALPYLALCYIPSLRAKLPKPGHWMETFRQFLAFPMFITAAWLVWVLSQQTTSTGLLSTLIALTAITFSFWMIRVLPAKGIMRLLSQFLLILSIGFVIISPFILESALQNTTETSQYGAPQNGDNWEMFTPEKLSTFLNGNDPVFTNMTASWCITCKVNERIALKTSTAKKIFIDNNIAYLKGDWTNQNPEITKYLKSFNRSGVPLYVYYGPRNAENGERPNPVVLPQLLTSGIIKRTIQ